MDRRIAIVGVPWSDHELVPAVRDALAEGARLVLVDRAESLEAIGPALDLDRVAVPELSPAAVARALAGQRVDAVASITELMMELAAEVREALGLHGTPLTAERAVSDKAATRTVLGARGLTAVRHWETTIDALPTLLSTIEEPVVLKPRALTGSAGVRLLRSAADAADLDTQYDADEARRFGRDRLLLESVISGVEISAEALCVDGRVTLLALTDKVNTGAPHFFEIGHLMPSRFTAAWWDRVLAYLQEAAQALGLVTSPIHAELMLSGDGIELVEIHSRFGGDNIVRLMEKTLSVAPFALYFAALLDHRAPASIIAGETWGIGYFTVYGCAGPWSRSFSFPRPEAVVEIDFNARRQPKITRYEGVKLLYRRLGHMVAASARYADVEANIRFLAGERPGTELI